MPIQLGERKEKDDLKIKVFTNNKNKGKLVKPYSTTCLCLCNSEKGMKNEAAKLNLKTLIVARNNCRFFQSIFDSDRNFHDHCSHSHSRFVMEI